MKLHNYTLILCVVASTAYAYNSAEQQITQQQEQLRQQQLRLQKELNSHSSQKQLEKELYGLNLNLTVDQNELAAIENQIKEKRNAWFPGRYRDLLQKLNQQKQEVASRIKHHTTSINRTQNQIKVIAALSNKLRDIEKQLTTLRRLKNNQIVDTAQQKGLGKNQHGPRRNNPVGYYVEYFEDEEQPGLRQEEDEDHWI